MPQLYAEGSLLQVLFLTSSRLRLRLAGRTRHRAVLAAGLDRGGRHGADGPCALRFLHFALFQEPLLEPVT